MSSFVAHTAVCVRTSFRFKSMIAKTSKPNANAFTANMQKLSWVCVTLFKSFRIVSHKQASLLRRSYPIYPKAYSHDHKAKSQPHAHTQKLFQKWPKRAMHAFSKKATCKASSKQKTTHASNKSKAQSKLLSWESNKRFASLSSSKPQKNHNARTSVDPLHPRKLFRQENVRCHTKHNRIKLSLDAAAAVKWGQSLDKFLWHFIEWQDQVLS